MPSPIIDYLKARKVGDAWAIDVDDMDYQDITDILDAFFDAAERLEIPLEIMPFVSTDSRIHVAMRIGAW
jgi:hypothetical protein